MLRTIAGVVAAVLLCVAVLAVVAGTSIAWDEQRAYERWESRKGYRDRYDRELGNRDHRPWYK